jgi:hypothetical protein
MVISKPGLRLNLKGKATAHPSGAALRTYERAEKNCMITKNPDEPSFLRTSPSEGTGISLRNYIKIHLMPPLECVRSCR